MARAWATGEAGRLAYRSVPRKGGLQIQKLGSSVSMTTGI
jgi:hypothetical protein